MILAYSVKAGGGGGKRACALLSSDLAETHVLSPPAAGEELIIPLGKVTA